MKINLMQIKDMKLNSIFFNFSKRKPISIIKDKKKLLFYCSNKYFFNNNLVNIASTQGKFTTNLNNIQKNIVFPNKNNKFFLKKL